jgi:hypothetical protein
VKALQHPAARVAAALLALAAGGLGILYVAARVLLAPLPGEWAVPLRWGPVTLQAGVPTLARLATAPWLAPLLHERTLATRAGPVQVRWLAGSRTLALHCAPCALRAPALGDEPLAFEEVVFTLQRQGEQISGHLSSGKVRANWRSSLQKEKGEEDGMRLRLQLPMTPIADVYALFGAAIPERAQARIEGELALTGTLSLPGGELSMAPPQVKGFQVSGLGTEKFIDARASCSAVASRLNGDSWLAHAVVAAQDPRFYQRSSHDLAELGAALASDPSQSQPNQAARGNTLPRQLLKLMMAGDEGRPMHPLRELLYTVEMERTLGKERILLLYLAHAPWGPGVCGAEAASRHYLGVRADVLTASQAAWLAAMLHNPALEVEHWASSGQINVARTQSVLQGMRVLPRQQRQRLAEEVAKVRWKAPTAPPR